MSNQLQNPFSDIVGESSPVQRAIKLIWELVSISPSTKANTAQSKSNSVLILTHLLGLMGSIGLVNCRGYHSSAITLMRAIEDAMDCFAAVGIDADAAIRWQDGELRGSDAAKVWTQNIKISGDTELSQYRKHIRTSLNNYSHCTPKQAHWNLYLESLGNGKCTVELNTKSMVINLNAYYIDRYLCIHIFELIEVLKLVYEDYLSSHESIYQQLNGLHQEIEVVITDFLNDMNSKKLDISVAPEISRIQ
ncbi:MAG: hypothetical protein LIO46_03525 [Clostridiales bacterium]|nr:hypothetical protein [Clostridiales bacterium]